MKFLTILTLILTFNLYAKEQLRGPSSFLMEKNIDAKSSKMNCYGNCGDSCYVLTKYQSKQRYNKNEKDLMKSEALSLCEAKTAEVICLGVDSENDLLHNEMCNNRFEGTEEAVSASVSIDSLIESIQ